MTSNDALPQFRHYANHKVYVVRDFAKEPDSHDWFVQYESLTGGERYVRLLPRFFGMVVFSEGRAATNRFVPINEQADALVRWYAKHRTVRNIPIDIEEVEGSKDG
jgi:hypothetical protein